MLPERQFLHMISRRSVRIKVMQAIYGFERTEGATPETFRLSLKESILSVKDLYIFLLLSVREIANKVDDEARIKANKFLPTDEDKLFSTKLLSNSIIQYLNHDKEFTKEVMASRLMDQMDDNINKVLYKKMVASEEYIAYLNSGEEFNFEADKKIVSYIFDHLVLSEELFLQHIEEEFPSWDDDAVFVVDAVREVFKKSKSELKLHIEKETMIDKFDELISFGTELYEKVLDSKDDLIKQIEPYLKNWEMDRIAVLDLIMIRMALTEFTDFNSIPVKVTMNEYIDIAKDYSTPKSKDFINGILDRMMREMKHQGKIKKTGRGLIE